MSAVPELFFHIADLIFFAFEAASYRLDDFHTAICAPSARVSAFHPAHFPVKFHS
jgi:hypothetical protein